MDGVIRIGLVSDINAATKKARVLYPETNMVSAWLSILRHGDDSAWMPKINDVVLCLYLPIFNADGFIVGVIQ